MKKLRLFLAIAMLAPWRFPLRCTSPAPVEAGGEIAVIVKTVTPASGRMFRLVPWMPRKNSDQITETLCDLPRCQSESNVNEQINIVESAIDRGVKAIVLAPLMYGSGSRSEKSQDAGIPVIIIEFGIVWRRKQLRHLPGH
jgi:hypothetical protein